ncbi:unnamed protein product, partial [Closterium sp. NIES-54]
LNLWPRVSVPETSPTLRWTGEVGDASVIRVWGSRAFVRNTSADKLSSRAVPCVFLGFVPDAPGWQFYHPTSRRVFPSQDVTFDESIPFYHLFPYRTAPLPPPPLFFTPGAASVDPLPPQGPAPSGVSQVDPVEPVEVAVDSGPVRGTEPGGAETGGAETGGAEPGDAEPRGAETRGAEPGGAEPGGAVPRGAEPGGHEPEGTALGGALLSQQLHEWYSQHCRRHRGAVGAGGATGAGAEGAGATGAGVAADPGVGAGGAGATGLGGARTGSTGGAGTGGAAGAAGSAGGADARPTEGAGADGAVGAGALGGTGVGAAGAGAAAGGAGDVSAGSGGAARPQPYFVPLLQQPASPLPAPFPYTGPTGGLTERREPASRLASPVRAAHTGRRVPRQRPPAVLGTHQMALRPSTAPQRVPLPSPPASSLPALADPESDSHRAASPTVMRLLATVVTDPSFESTAASALVAELVDFAAHCCLDYAA